MDGTESTVVVPLLFAKPGTATMPLLRVSIIPDGGGSLHDSIRHPLEVLDQSELPADELILRLLLPRYDRLDNYTASYVFPPRDVNQFVDDFPDGLSHLLTVLLAFYALSADHTLEQDLFKPRLSEWAASAYPDKTGVLRGVSRLREKIGALVAENKEIERFGCKGVSNLILAREDRQALDSIEFVLVPLEGEGGRCREIPVTKREVSKTQTQLEVSYGDGTTRIAVHFSTNFNEALELVFGADLVRRYARSLAAGERMIGRKRVFRSIPGLSKEVQDPLRLAYQHELDELAPSAAVQASVQRAVPEKVSPKRIFVSYARSEDVPLVARIKEDLEKAGHSVWFDESETKSGKDWESAIEEGLISTHVVLAVLSPEAVRRPDGVCLDEISFAHSLGKHLVPLMIRKCRLPLSISRVPCLDMQDCEESEERYQEKLCRIREVVEGRRDSFEGDQARLLEQLRPIDFHAEIEQKVRGFCGRQWVFDSIEAWLEDPSASRVFFLTGAPGVGKTAIAAMLCHRHPSVAAYHLCSHSDAARSQALRCVISLAYQLSTQLPEYRDRLLALRLSEIHSKDARAAF